MQSMSGGNTKRFVGVFALVLAVLGTTAGPGDALDQGSVGTMDPKKTTHIKKDYPPIPGVYPHQGATGHPFSGFRPFGCATYNYCSRHTFDVSVPPGYLESFKGSDIVSYGVRITLTWPDPKANDVDLFVWPDDDPALGGPNGVCGAPKDEECNTLHPEVFSLVEPKPEDDAATEEDESKLPVTIYMSVVNDTGVNTGYTLDLQWFLIPFGSFPEFKPPKDRKVSRPVTASRTPEPFVADGGSDEPDPKTKILIPGKDGKLVEQTLDFLATGHRFKSERAGTAGWVWIVTAVLSALAIGGFGILVWRRRRGEHLA
jgi:hypothetical protein